MTLDKLCKKKKKKNTRQQSLSFLAPKTSTKISQNTKNAKTTTYITHASKKLISNKLCR